MARIDKYLKKMQQNPRDWRIDDIKVIATSLNIQWIHDGGSHVIFRSPNGRHLSIPAHRPIKPIYITEFLSLVNSLREIMDEDITTSC